MTNEMYEELKNEFNKYGGIGIFYYYIDMYGETTVDGAVDNSNIRRMIGTLNLNFNDEETAKADIEYEEKLEGFVKWGTVIETKSRNLLLDENTTNELEIFNMKHGVKNEG